MSYNQLANVIFLGHGVLFEEIEAVITDYSALGQTRSSSWIDTSSSTTDRSVKLVTNSPQLVDLDTALRQVTGITVVVALEELDDAITTDYRQVDAWLAAVESRVPGRVSRVRVLLPRLPHQVAEPMHREGWATIAVAPEDSDSPLASISPIGRDAGISGAARVYAPTLLSLLGLWRSANHVPVLDAEGRAISTGSESTFRLARAHHRSVDASEVEAALLAQVVDISEHMPQTQFADGRQAVYLNDPKSTGFEYSRQVLRKHSPSLLTPMEPEAGRTTIQQSGFAAVKSFLREYFRAVVGNPRMWGQSLSSKTAETVAGAIQRGLYGEKSVVEVVVGSASGRPASIEQLRHNAQLIQARTQESGLRIEPEPVLSGLWQDYCKAALTLVDGADRLPEPLNGPMDNSRNPAIVRRGEQAVPDVSAAFDGFHPILDDIAGMTPEQARILPFDVDRAQYYEDELNYVASHSTDSAVMKLREDFQAWKNRVSESFAWSTGVNLLHLLQLARGNARTNWEKLGQAEAELAAVKRRDFADENRKLAKTLAGFSMAWLLLVLLIAYCTVRYYRPDWRFFLPNWQGLDWRWCLLSLFVVTVVIMGIQMVVFMRARRGIIDEQERLQRLETNLQVALRNYNNSVGDVRKITGAYGQFLSWSTVLGRTIARPFGNPTITQQVLPIPHSGLPRSTQIGRAVISDNAMTTLVNDVRAKVYKPSWAEEAFGQFITDVFEVIRQREGTNPIRIAELYGQAGHGSHSTLDRLSMWAISPDLDSRNQLKAQWERAIFDPAIIRRLDQALDTVEFYESGQLRQVSKSHFLAALRDINWQQVRFSNAAVTSAGVSRNATNIDPDLSDVEGKDPNSTNLTQAVTVCQFGPAVSLTYLRNEDATHPKSDPQPNFSFEEPSEFRLDDNQNPTFGDFDFGNFNGLV